MPTIVSASYTRGRNDQEGHLYANHIISLRHLYDLLLMCFNPNNYILRVISFRAIALIY